jgi:hypothetical protein
MTVWTCPPLLLHARCSGGAFTLKRWRSLSTVGSAVEMVRIGLVGSPATLTGSGQSPLSATDPKGAAMSRPPSPSASRSSKGALHASTHTMRVCIVGGSGKLGRYMVQHALGRGYEVVGVCREKSVGKLAEFEGRITVVPGATDDRDVIKRAVAGCDGVLVVLVPRGVHGYSSGTAQAVLDHAEPGARLVFSCGWHITRDGRDVYSWRLKGTRQRLRPPRTARPLRRPRRPGGGLPAHLRQRQPLDRRAWQRPRGGRQSGPARVEPPRGRPHPREQHHAPCGLRAIHGGGARKRRPHSRGPRDRQPPEPFGARARRCLTRG